jgi:hypothetical protein
VLTHGNIVVVVDDDDDDDDQYQTNVGEGTQG